MKPDVTSRRHALRLYALAVIVGLLAGCSPPAFSGGASAWIVVPLDGLSFPNVQAIKIAGHAASPGGVRRVEILIDGALLTTINDPPMQGGLAAFHVEWAPSAPGEYTIQAVAYGADGTASLPDSARVSFGEGIATPVVTPAISVTPVTTDTPTIVPGAVVQFWADPAEIAAGSCSDIRWRVEDASRVVFGGVDQPFDGSYRDCLCASQSYTLTVIHLDGSEERRTVDVAVTGSCASPTVPPDTTPPPAPTPAVPADGLTVACTASQSLAWLPVEDPSGIAEYRVEVQRHSGDNNWQAAPGGSISVADKTTSVPVECAWYYRWRVRAVDGAGNVGAWSGWWQFAVTLG